MSLETYQVDLGAVVGVDLPGRPWCGGGCRLTR